MLEPEDLEFIAGNREQITKLRTIPIMLTREVVGTERDLLTGEYKTTTVTDEVYGTFRRITSGGAGSDDIVMVNGILAEAGDALVNLPIHYDMDGATHLTIDGERWRIRSTDAVGLGGANRHYVLIKKVT